MTSASYLIEMGCSRAMNPDFLAFGNHSSQFTTTDLQKIDTTDAYKIS
jgi:hypothetical protein